MNNIKNVKIWSLLAIMGPTRRLYGFNRGLHLSLLFLSSSAALMREAKKITRSFIIKTAQILAIFSHFKPFGASKGPLNGSLRGPWPFILMFHTRWQYLYMEFPSPTTFEKKQIQNPNFLGYFQLFRLFGGPLRNPGGPHRHMNQSNNQSFSKSINHPSNKQ